MTPCNWNFCPNCAMPLGENDELEDMREGDADAGSDGNAPTKPAKRRGKAKGGRPPKATGKTKAQAPPKPVAPVKRKRRYTPAQRAEFRRRMARARAARGRRQAA